KRPPRQVARILDGQHLDRPAETDVEAVALDLDRPRVAAMDAVVLEEESVVRRGGEVIDDHDLEVLPLGLGDGSEDIAADAAEARDGDPGRHYDFLPTRFPVRMAATSCLLSLLRPPQRASRPSAHLL